MRSLLVNTVLQTIFHVVHCSTLFPSDDGTCIIATRKHTIEQTIIYRMVALMTMSNKTASIPISALHIHRHTAVVDVDFSAIARTHQTRCMTSTLDATRHMQILEGGIHHLAERSDVRRSAPLYVHVQRVSVTIENSSVGNTLLETHTIHCAKITIHDGIHVRFSIRINHQLQKPIPVSAGAQHMVRYAIDYLRIIIIVGTPHLPRH